MLDRFGRLPLVTAACTVFVVSGAAGWLSDARAAGEDEPAILALPPARALGVRVDTLLLGGYASGTFTDALRVLASDLDEAERSLVGQHLDKIFLGVVENDGLGRTGRLRVAYERAVRPDGSTRSIRVLAAEAAASGEMHTAFFFERGELPGYYDPLGRSLDPDAWGRPLGTPEPRVTSPFGRRRMHPILRRLLPHTGVDYAARSGTPVLATGDGYVSHAGRRGGYGNLVEIQHPSGYSSRYAHLSAIAPGVARGRMVRQGEVIGRVGMTGLATGPHLHYEVRRQGQPVDPTRVAVGSGVAADLGASPGWPLARQRLSQLLARTPTVAQGR